MNAIMFEIIKALIVGFAGWLLKMNANVKKVRKELNMAFCKIRALEKELERLNANPRL